MENPVLHFVRISGSFEDLGGLGFMENPVLYFVRICGSFEDLGGLGLLEVRYCM
jgi:hypothetical protein